MTMCTRFVYRGDNIITGFNFDIDIVEWNHKVINTKDCFYIGIMRPDGMRHSYHGVNLKQAAANPLCRFAAAPHRYAVTIPAA